MPSMHRTVTSQGSTLKDGIFNVRARNLNRPRGAACTATGDRDGSGAAATLERAASAPDGPTGDEVAGAASAVGTPAEPAAGRPRPPRVGAAAAATATLAATGVASYALLSSAPELPPHAIVVADDLTPSQLTRLPREQLAGVVLARGGATNHVAILCRALAIPALVACGPAALTLAAGSAALLNAGEGWLDGAADAAALDAARQDIAQREQRRRTLREQSAGQARTRDGVAIEVAANIANAAEARDAVLNGADGVGLLRTEFLFIDRHDAPSEDEQRAACQDVLDALQGRPAIIRTLDAGGDKDVPYLPLPAEDNPALGLRGIRTGFAMPEVLDTQLRALLQVKPLSRLRILLPMVADLADLQRVRQRLDELAAELGVAERPQLGVMIEVPSAALLADQLAQHADFLSIGTNDLTQYTLAMDRCHPALAANLDALHPALLRLIALTVHGAAKHGKWVGVCGALASDPQATPVLVGLGVTELSVSPQLVPEIKDAVRRLDSTACQQLALDLQALNSAQQVRARLQADAAALLR